MIRLPPGRLKDKMCVSFVYYGRMPAVGHSFDGMNRKKRTEQKERRGHGMHMDEEKYVYN